jgi:hypothetical protein
MEGGRSFCDVETSLSMTFFFFSILGVISLASSMSHTTTNKTSKEGHVYASLPLGLPKKRNDTKKH